MTTHKIKANWLAIAFSPSLVKRSLLTMFIVGTILNLINQWSTVTGELPINWVSLALTFFVPYAVSTVSGTFTLLDKQNISDLSHNRLNSYSAHADAEKLLALTNKITQNAKNVNEVSKKRVVFVEQTANTAKSASEVSEFLTNSAQSSEMHLREVEMGFHNICTHIADVGENVKLAELASNVDQLAEDTRKAIGCSAKHIELGSSAIQLSRHIQVQSAV